MKMADDATNGRSADGVTHTFDFGYGLPLMVRVVDFNALYAKCREDAAAAAAAEREKIAIFVENWTHRRDITADDIRNAYK